VASVDEGSDDLATLPSISLAQLVELADLQERFESKHLVPTSQLSIFLRELAERRGSVNVLEIDGRRSQHHTNEYFDSPDMQLYRDHVQGRRRRYKVRTRRYESDPVVYAELKTKDGRGRTIKHRIALPRRQMTELPTDVWSSLHDELQRIHAGLMPVELMHSASVRYRRATLVLGGDGDAAAERVTIDRDVVAVRRGALRHLGRSCSIVEVKSARPHAVATAALVSLGHRPTSLSKYCLAVASVDDAERSHPWISVLRALGGRARS